MLTHTLDNWCNECRGSESGQWFLLHVFSRKKKRVTKGSAHVNTPVQVPVVVPPLISTTLLRIWNGLGLVAKPERMRVCLNPLTCPKEASLGFMLLHKIQANRWRGLIKAPFRRRGLTEIDGYVSANNRGIPQVVNIASLIQSKAGT